jgi:hypothetical protein
MTVTKCLPCSSSSGVKVRPRAGRPSTTWKVEAATAVPSTRSVFSPSLRLKEVLKKAETFSSVFDSARTS